MTSFFHKKQLVCARQFETRFILFLDVTSLVEDQAFGMYLTRTGDITVAWGDGSRSEYKGAAAAVQLTHVYATPGDYTIKIRPWKAISLLRVNNPMLRYVRKMPAIANNAIQENAFSYCYNLQEFPGWPEDLVTVGGYAFNVCYDINPGPLPDTVTSIGQYAFNGCRNLVWKALPENLTTIGQYAFNGASQLNLDSIPDNVSTIGNYAFSDCPYLKITRLPDSLKTIGQYAFQNCNRIQLSEIPAHVTTLGNRMFTGYEGLFRRGRLLFLGTPSSISSSAFTNVGYNLSDIYVPWASGEVANAPWGVSAQAHYGAVYSSSEELDAYLDTHPVVVHSMVEDTPKADTGQTVTVTGTAPTPVNHMGKDCLRFIKGSYYMIGNSMSKGLGVCKELSLSFWFTLTDGGDVARHGYIFRFGCGVPSAGSSFVVGRPDIGGVGMAACVASNSTLMAASNLVYTQLCPVTDREWHHVVMRCKLHPGQSSTWEADVFWDGEYKVKLTKGVTNSIFKDAFYVGGQNVCISMVKVFATCISDTTARQLYDEGGEDAADPTA